MWFPCATSPSASRWWKRQPRVKLASLPGAPGDLAQGVSDENANNKPDPEPEYETAYLSALQAHLCPQRDQVLRSLFVVTMHLQSWSSVVTQSVEHGWDLGTTHTRCISLFRWRRFSALSLRL